MATKAVSTGSGTVAALQPRPASVDEADRLVAQRVARPEAAKRLADSFPAEDLRAAQLWWVRRMPKRQWDDHHPAAVLRVLETALAISDPLLPKENVRR